MVQTHVYQRELDPASASSDSLSVIYSKIADNSLVLDVGAGSGALGRALKLHKNCRVHGLSYNAAEVSLLHGNYDVAVQVNLEEEPLPETISEHRYDFVVCADVLEHLKNAQAILARLMALLKPGGRLILSVPNVSHASVLVCLLNGRFVRTHEGLLDATHVHFFERQSLQAFCDAAGGQVVERDAVRRHMANTEFSEVDATVLPQEIRQYLEALPDADVYQFVWSLVPAAAEVIVDDCPTQPQLSVVSRFQIKIYLDRGTGFTESDTTFAYGHLGDEVQDIVVKLPAITDPIVGLRIDWPHWMGVMEFGQLTLHDADNRTVLTWNGSWSDAVSWVDCLVTSERGQNGLPVMLLSGEAAFFEMRLAAPLNVDVLKLHLGAVMRMPMQTAARFLHHEQPVAKDFQSIRNSLLALEEHVRYIGAQTVHREDQSYYWSALNQRLDNLENRLLMLQSESAFFSRVFKRLFRRIKGWIRGA